LAILSAKWKKKKEFWRYWDKSVEEAYHRPTTFMEKGKADLSSQKQREIFESISSKLHIITQCSIASRRTVYQ